MLFAIAAFAGGVAGLSSAQAAGDLVINNDEDVVADPNSGNPSIHITGNLYMGQSSVGALTIVNGGAVSNGVGYMGYSSSGNGTATVTGSGSAWVNNGDLFVGYSGTGNLMISSGGAVSDVNGVLGNNASGTGTGTVTGSGSTWTNSYYLHVGFSGKGELTVSDRGTVSSTYGVIGYEKDSIGTVEVTDSGSTWTNLGSLYVGDAGNGELAISSGGAVSNEAGVIGYQKDGIGKVEVSGIGSAWTNRGGLYVGDSGTGGLAIFQGGVVSNDEGVIGHEMDGSGTVEVTGGGSAWTNLGSLYVGDSGRGRLTVADGGVVSNTYGVIGYEMGGIGTVEVTGSGSTWSNLDSLYVGLDGVGSLSVKDHGLVTAAAGVRVGYGATANGTLDVKTGGVLETRALGAGGGTVSVVFDEGILRATGNNNAFITGFTPGRFIIGAGGLTVDDNGFSIATDDSVLAGTGGLTKAGNGTLTLGGRSTYVGVTTAASGKLKAGIEGAFSTASDFVVRNGAILDANGLNQIIASLRSDGSVVVGSEGSMGPVGATLTVTGDYVGNNGTLALRTVLGDDASVTDRLAIAGDTAGSTSVKVANSGGVGAPTVEGIRIIGVAGASDGMFTLIGDYTTKDDKQAIKAGAYAYTLEKHGISTPSDGDWYLRSRLGEAPSEPGAPEMPRYQAGAPIYEAYPQTLLGLNRVSTLQQRVGNRLWGANSDRAGAEGTIEGRGAWGRIEGAHGRVEPGGSDTGVDYEQNIFKLQTGIDGMLMENDSGRLIGGVSMHYVHGLARTTSIYDAKAGGGRISTDGYGLGGTLTRYEDSGVYLDAQAQTTWYESDLSYGGGKPLARGNDGFGYALSLEGGKRMTIGPSLFLTPQAQLVYSRVDFDHFREVDNTAVGLRRAESLQGRLGVALDHERSWRNVNGKVDRAHIYGIADLYYEFLDGTKVDVAGVSLANRKDRLAGGIGFGGSFNWADDKYSIYAEGLVNTSLDNFGDSYFFRGDIGFRMRW